MFESWSADHPFPYRCDCGQLTAVCSCFGGLPAEKRRSRDIAATCYSRSISSPPRRAMPHFGVLPSPPVGSARVTGRSTGTSSGGGLTPTPWWTKSAPAMRRNSSGFRTGRSEGISRPQWLDTRLLNFLVSTRAPAASLEIFRKIASAVSSTNAGDSGVENAGGA